MRTTEVTPWRKVSPLLGICLSEGRRSRVGSTSADEYEREMLNGNGD